MRLKLFEEFRKDKQAPDVNAVLKSVYDGKAPKWIEPTRKGKLDLPEAQDGKDEGTVIFELGGVSVSIDYNVWHSVTPGQQGDGYNTPDDPNETELTDLDIIQVEVSDESGSQTIKGDDCDAAWLFMYKLLPEAGDSSTKKKAAKLKEKLGWK